MKVIVLLYALLYFVECTTLEDENEADDLTLENPDLFEGDIVLDEDDRNAVVKKEKLWPKGRVPYVISSSLEDKKDDIKIAMKHIENSTCIRFSKRSVEKNYVKFYKGSGCSSKIGMKGGEQTLSLGEGCYKMGKIVHEIVHALGFYHEQSRSDRDDYINIHWENIKKGHESNFVKLKPKENLLLGPYDYKSITHYHSTVFSKDKEKGLLTITPKQKGVVLKKVGEKTLSKLDIVKIKKLYKCP